MDVVNSSHSYATGGTSVNEFWYVGFTPCTNTTIESIMNQELISIVLYITGTIQNI